MSIKKKKCPYKENKKRNKKTQTKSIATTMSDGSYLSNNAAVHDSYISAYERIKVVATRLKGMFVAIVPAMPLPFCFPLTCF